MTLPTLLDIAKINGSDGVVGLIDETIRLIPEISGMTEEGTRVPGMGAARTISGLSYKTLVRTGLPTVSFRNANEGTDPSKATYENRTVETFIMEPRWECDKAIADRAEDGASSFIALEASAIMEATFQLLGRQFFYGRNTNGDAKGHPGLIDSIQAAYTVDATGAGVDTSSLWAVKFGPKHVQWVYGNGGSLTLSDVRTESLLDANSKKYDGYVQTMLAYPGVQVGSVYSLGRIKNLDAGKPLTDDLIFSLLEVMKVRPDCFFCTKRSREELRQSRTATNATGAPAPLPAEVAGIPIVVTESLLDTETAS